MTTRRRGRQPPKEPAWSRLLPANLLELPLQGLPLPAGAAEALQARGVLTVRDALAATARDLAALVAAGHTEAVRAALQPVLDEGLRSHATVDADDWATVRTQLLAPLGDPDRAVFRELVGLDQPPDHRPVLARSLGLSLGELDDRAEQVRSVLGERCPTLLARLHREAATELAAFEGVVLADQLTPGSLVHGIAHAGTDRELPLRLLAFLFPREVHLHRGTLYGLSPRRFRRLARTLPDVVAPHRLPARIDDLLAALAAAGHEVPRGLLIHLLRTELHIAIEVDGAHGEVAAADPRSPGVRLVELLLEAEQPLALPDLVFAYRERFRRASTATLQRHLRRSAAFVQVGPDTWSLRRWHEAELAGVAPLVDKVARRLATDGGRHHVAALLAGDGADARTVFLVLDRLACDPRVRMLGRGDACAATHRRSQVMEGLLQAFRRAGGDVVTSMFLDNQPPEQRRLVERLLRHNRLFVQPAADRTDTLSNYPFNSERLRRLVVMVGELLHERSGYAHLSAVKAHVDRTDLGGGWLSPQLLGDVLRRNGPFELLPGGIVARADLDLGHRVLRTVRQALRDAGVPLSVEEVLQARPDLGEFAACLGELLGTDPLVQSPDGVRYVVA